MFPVFKSLGFAVGRYIQRSQDTPDYDFENQQSLWRLLLRSKCPMDCINEMIEYPVGKLN